MNKQYLCSTSDLNKTQAKGVTLTQEHADDIHIIVLKQQEHFYAYLNKCPHRNIQLEWNKDEFFDESGSFLHCFTHGALFLPKTGECIAGPCQFQSLEKVPIFIEDDTIYCDPERGFSCED
ncbi:Rieske (2Fe-2S) protein [Marinomonas sp. 2405UD68-3]|uniref:Rieske (2Fe-2S) protein n=1 Tax=Marinomonas sp. 2405UD68-3 TaxID=3391835 RepID=UPI0039C9F1CC